MEGRRDEAAVGDRKGSMNRQFTIKNPNHAWMEEIRGSLMIVATVIATITFQISINPPGGVWQSDSNVDDGCATNTTCKAGTSVLAFGGSDQKTIYEIFIMLCTISFSTSLTIILLLMVGFPLRNRLVMWSFIIAMCLSVMCLAGSYIIAILMVTAVSNSEEEHERLSKAALCYVMFWGGFCALFCLALFGRFLYWLVKMLFCLLRCCCCCRTSTAHHSSTANP